MMQTGEKKTVPIELGVRMKSLGIRQRKSDGRFTFHLDCPVCGAKMPGWCWCTNTLEEAIEAVQMRTNPYACSNKCLWKYDEWWMKNDDYVSDCLKDADDVKLPKGFRLLYSLKKRHPRIYHRLQKQYANMVEGDDGDGDFDGFQACDCEVQ